MSTSQLDAAPIVKRRQLFPIVHRAATASRFQAVICVGWTSSLVASSATVKDLE